MITKPEEVRKASTLLLVRDSIEGIQVFMLLRNLRSDFAGGAYVFPGGKVDEADHDWIGAARVAGLDDAIASEKLSLLAGGLAYWVAAVRECFEEAGLLMAYDNRGELINLELPTQHEKYTILRRKVYQTPQALAQICEQEDLYLALDKLHYFSHWITPEGAPKRYDTRFFVGVAPAEQIGHHDEEETVEHRWIRPQQALDECEKGNFTMIFPTIKNLQEITRHQNTASLINAVKAKQHFPAILPKMVRAEDGTVQLLIPGDVGYPE